MAIDSFKFTPRLIAAFYQTIERQPDLPIVALCSAAELGRAIGRDRVVHLLILPGGLADRLLAEAGRLEGFVGESVSLSREPSLS